MKIMSFVFVCAVCEACSSVGYQLVAQQVEGYQHKVAVQVAVMNYISLHVNTLLCVVDDNHDIIS